MKFLHICLLLGAYACFAAAMPESGTDCEGEGSWKKDCNTCRCLNGRGVCTKRLCPPGLQANDDCRGTVSFKIDCNTCNCANGKAVCTTQRCNLETTRIDGAECKGSGTWRDECNWCQCTLGKGVCTRKLCPIPLPPSVLNEPECRDTISFKRDCNTCNCVNGRAICTQKFCGALQNPGVEASATVVERECTPGSQWKDDCNDCACTESGNAVCTLMACAGDTRQTCQEGAVWKQDCNTCSCSNGQPICTLALCPSPLEGKCREGERWVQNCNTCRCANGLPLCTKKGCVRNLPNLCKLPTVRPDAPQCEAHIPKWTYDSNDRTCKQIIYGGCGGTENLFDSEADCARSCIIPVQGPSPKGPPGRSNNQDRCFLTPESGPCFAIQPKFYYDSNTRNCESFNYGGCQGNGNRFETSQECQQACDGAVGRSPGVNETCDRSQCPWSQWGHYIAKGCLPQYDKNICCPISFTCPEKSVPTQDTCMYKNKAYKIGQEVPVTHECSRSCRCFESHIPGGLASITCANIECPELFRPFRPGCRPLYQLGQCCAYDQECSDPRTPAILEQRTPTCDWKNKTYHEGDKMYFDEYPCQKCICTGEFTGPFGSGCTKIDCGFQFRYTERLAKGCTPVYFGDGCCPIDFLCPDDEAVKEHHTEVASDISEGNPPDRCYFGSMAVNVGKSIKLSRCEMTCSCVTPPEITCVQYGTCEAIGALSKDENNCPPITCDSTCNVVTDVVTGCLKCSCENQTFTCTDPKCPPLCDTIINYDTGCLECDCKGRRVPRASPLKLCPVGPDGRVPCPADCGIRRRTDPRTGCEICECDPNSTGNPFVTFPPSLICPLSQCPQDCAVIRKTNPQTGCEICECDPNSTGNPFVTPPQACPVGPNGRPPCPVDCAIRRRRDPFTGCEICECDPNDTSNPFVTLPPSQICPLNPPCPQDCAVIRKTDPQTGCEICECDPNSTGNPFVTPPPAQACPVGPNGRPPCPVDCAIRRRRDPFTGCEICECDPNDTGNPFVTFPPSQICPLNPPCPQDCAVIRKTDPQTGCEICECDPNSTGNPFVTPPQACPVGPNGRPPCPVDCAIRRRRDPFTGCEICECDPNSTGNPFVTLPPVQACPVGPNGRPPCPVDCAIRRIRDPQTGCEICECDPNSTGNPFITLPPVHPCPIGPNGRPPCPVDCAIRKRRDPSTGCEICECDPNDTGNPFGPLPPSNRCPLDPDGQAPCPQDCAVIRRTDPRTGCEICECNPINPGNPFVPFNFRRPIHRPQPFHRG